MDPCSTNDFYKIFATNQIMMGEVLVVIQLKMSAASIFAHAMHYKKPAQHNVQHLPMICISSLVLWSFLKTTNKICVEYPLTIPGNCICPVCCMINYYPKGYDSKEYAHSLHCLFVKLKELHIVTARKPLIHQNQPVAQYLHKIQPCML